MNPEMQKWLEGRPPIIRQLAERFPPGSMIHMEAETLYVLGYDEDGGLIVTDVVPGSNYAEAVKRKRTLCPHCVEGLEFCGATVAE